ncbi:MAG: ATP-binding protein [Butyrivibrio sp.]|nr:ATP-binding protein [Butyrivibrio sp.]
MYYVYIGIQIIGIIICFMAQVLLLYGDGSKEQKLMNFFVGGSMIQNCGYLLELLAQSREAAIMAAKIQYLGSTYIALCFCWFIYSYCNMKVPEMLLRVLSVLDLGILAIIFTCDFHTLYYTEMRWEEGVSGRFYLTLSYGPAYYLFLIFACAIPYAMSYYALFYTVVIKKKKMEGRRYKSFLAIALLPLAALTIYMARLIPNFDLTPVTVGVVLSGIVLLVWGRKNYDFSRMALEVAMRNMDDGVIMLDDKKRIVSYNPAAAAIFTELCFQSVGDSIEDMEDFPENVLDEDTRNTFELNGKSYESHVRQIPGKREVSQGYVVLVMDVTETRDYIEELKNVRRQAEQANIAKSEFLANMSHEIRTPMNAVVGLSEIIMEESRGRKVYGYACDIRSAAQNLLTIINDILDLSKAESGKMELVTDDYYIRAVVRDVVNMMDIAAFQRGLTLQCEYDESIPIAYHGDAGRIKQILINIMNNAVKFTKEGYVKISVGGTPGEEPDTELVSFRIEDTGCGIRPEDMEKIFEDFKQVDAKRNRGVEGTGLGLSITKRLVRLMRGTIELESVYGEGTTFIIKIPQKIVDRRPLAEVQDIPVQEAAAPEAFTVSSYKVLVVDDNKINRKVAMGFLKKYGFELTEAESGREAIDLVKKTEFNIIFMDHMMPGMDGVEATRIIRSECGENGAKPVIVALTANAMEGVREKFLQLGFQDFVSKPIDRKALHEVLSRWIPAADRRPEPQGEPGSQGKEPDGQGKGPGNQEKGPGGQEKETDRQQDETAAAASPGFENINIAGIDVKEAVKHHSGGVEDYLELLELYCMDGRRKCGLLPELAAAKDCAAYQVEVHGLKSASANVGAMELSAQAKRHEEAAAEGDEAFITAQADSLVENYKKQLEEIENFLGSISKAGLADTSEEEAEMGGEEIFREIERALKALENFRSKESARMIEELLKHRLEPELAGKLKEIQEQLKMYEDDGAEELLRKLLEGHKKED